MTTQGKSLEELGRRAVACKHWRWMPGMRSLVGPGRAPYRYVTNEYAPPEGEDVGFSEPIVPDLSDPATLGCLLHLVREAWGRDAYIEVNKYERNGGRYLCDTQVGIAFPGQTEAEALVAALEAAP